MTVDAAQIQDYLARAQELEPQAAEALTRTMLAKLVNRKAQRQYPTPGAMACALDRDMRQTPALELIDQAIVDTIDNGGRLIITVPPQQGKSMRVSVWTPVWALTRRPDARIITASYAESLAQRNSTMARGIIQEHGTGALDPVTELPRPDRLGIQVARGNATKRAWGVHGCKGSYYATGVGGAVTGYSADLLLIDDPIKNQVQADSARERQKVWDWWASVAATRLSPKAAVIIVQTRWHNDDLAGRLIKQDRALPPDERVWQVLNIPAIAEDGIPDALGREPGVPLPSARGTTLDDFKKVRASVGERVWSALYQGSPVPSKGGLFAKAELDQYRLQEFHPIGKVVSVDPSESGYGDEAGILCLGWDHDGVIAVLQDKSRPLTSDAWAREAVFLAMEQGAGEIVYEAFTAKETYGRVLRQAWANLRGLVDIIDKYQGDLVAAQFAESPNGERGNLLEALQHAVPLADKVRPHAADAPPFRIVPWTARGDKVARAAGARQAVSTGRLRMLGTHKALEGQMVSWQKGESSPDRVDALVNGYEHTSAAIGQSGYDIDTPWG